MLCKDYRCPDCGGSNVHEDAVDYTGYYFDMEGDVVETENNHEVTIGIHCYTCDKTFVFDDWKQAVEEALAKRIYYGRLVPRSLCKAVRA